MKRQRTLAAVVASIVVLLLTGVTPAGAADGWQLIDNHQRSCYTSTRGGTHYYGVWIKGTWTRSIDVGADALPANASTYALYAPIAPGSSDGVGSLAYVAVALPAGTPVGTYTGSLWASDTTTTKRIPVTVVVTASRCSRY